MISIKKLMVRGLLLASVLLFGACGTTSPFSGYTNASEDDAKVVASGGYSEAAMAQIAIVQNPDFNGGKISAKALKKIQEYGISCQKQVDPQLSGAGQSGVSGALNYGVAGTGTGPAAAAAFGSAGNMMSKYATYGGIAYLLPGGVNGLYSGAYAMASAKGNCTQKFWEDVAKTDPDFRGTHVLVAHSGKTDNSAPPALKQSPTVKK